MQTESPLAFGDHLHQILARKNQTQSWLAAKMGVDRSTISRIVAKERLPGLPTLQEMAPVVGMTVEELVRNTNIEERIREASREASRVVRLADHEAALKQMVEYESLKNEAETKLRDEREQHAKFHKAMELQVGKAHHELAGVKAENQDLKDDNRRLRDEMQRYRRALEKAVGELGTHKQKIEELADLLQKVSEQSKGQSKLTKVATALAGVAAFAGVATLASLIGGENNAKEEENSDGTPTDRQESKKSNRK